MLIHAEPRTPQLTCFDWPIVESPCRFEPASSAFAIVCDEGGVRRERSRVFRRALFRGVDRHQVWRQILIGTVPELVDKVELGLGVEIEMEVRDELARLRDLDVAGRVVLTTAAIRSSGIFSLMWCSPSPRRRI